MSQGMERLFSYLPPYYQKSEIMRIILSAEGAEFDRFRSLLEDADQQQYILTGTWGLENWERLFGLPVDREQSSEERRGRILARRRSVTANLIEILRAVEPTLQAAFGGYIIPFTLYTSHNADEYEKFGELIKLLEEWKPAAYTYSFTVIPPDQVSGFTAYAGHGVSRGTINFVPEAGTLRSGRWPRWNTPGQSTTITVVIEPLLATGEGFYNFAGQLYSGPKEGKSNRGTVLSEAITVRGEPVSGFSLFQRSGTIRSGTMPIISTSGFMNRSTLGVRGSVSTGTGHAFPCGPYHSGEEVA